MFKNLSKPLTTYLLNLKSLRLNLSPLILFELAYYCIGVIAIMPFNEWLLRAALLYSNLSYVEGSDIVSAFSQPLVIIALLVLLVLDAFYMIIEFTTIILCYNESHNGHRVKLVPLVLAGLNRAVHILHPRNWGAMIFLVLIMPLVSFGLSSSFMSQFAIPGFIMSYIHSSMLLTFLLSALTIAMVVLIMHMVFCFHFFTLSNDDFIPSCRASFKCIRGHFFQTSIKYLLMVAAVFILSGITMILGGIIFFWIDHLGITTWLLAQAGTPSFKVSISLSFMSILASIIVLLFEVITNPLYLAAITASYYTNCEANGIALSTESLIPDSDHHFWTTYKRVAFVLVILVISACTRYAQIVSLISSDTIDNITGGPLIAGHRGNSVDTPENTKSALEKAIAEDADYVEIDVCETADGVLVVSHDNNLKRLTGQDINIWESNYADIKDLDIGSHFSPDFSDQRLMTLDEAMDICDGKIKMNIELKPTIHDVDFVEKSVKIFQEHNFYDKGFFASLDYPTLERVEQLDGRIRTCLNTFIALGDLEILPVDIYSVEATFATPALLKSIHASNKQLWVWTVNEESQMESIVKLGADGIVTDNPKLAIETTKENEPTPEEQFQDALYTIITSL